MSLMHRKGVLITCDIPTMQVIRFMDKQEGGKMIIKELDERNVFIHRTFSARALTAAHRPPALAVVSVPPCAPPPPRRHPGTATRC
jgi:hypothetical protein